MSIMKYHTQEIDRKWLEHWGTGRLYEVHEDSLLAKYYAVTMFPYTSGDLHISSLERLALATTAVARSSAVSLNTTNGQNV